MLELSATEPFFRELPGKAKEILLPLWRARRHRGDLQKVQSVGKRAVGTRQTCGRATFLKHHKADVNASIISKRTDTQWNAWLDVVKEFCKPSRANSASIFVSKTNDNRPFVRLYLNNWETEGLVDSGSNCTIIDGKGANLIQFRAGGKTFPSRLKTIRTADGKQHPVTKAIELEAMLDSSRRRIRVYYVPDLQHNVIQSDQQETKSRVLPHLLFYRNVFLSWISRFYLLAVDSRFVGCLPLKNLSLIAFINFL
jgi:hypothetical protein